MLKNLLINNFAALLIHFIIVVLTWLLLYVTIGKGQSLGPVWDLVWAWVAWFLIGGEDLVKT